MSTLHICFNVNTDPTPFSDNPQPGRPSINQFLRIVTVRLYLDTLGLDRPHFQMAQDI
jgi:hypothetical protein